MSTLRRSFAVALVTCLTVSGLSLDASAGVDAGGPDGPSVPAEPATPKVARGVIVQTTTSTPSDGLLSATDAALDGDADVVSDELVAPSISTVGFDGVVSADAAADVATQIEKRRDVVWAVPDVRIAAAGAPPVSVDDHFFPQQTNLWNAAYSSGGYSIKAPSLWRRTMGSPDVTVAVLDTGITTHTELPVENQVAGYDAIDDPITARDGDGRDADPQDPGDWNKPGECGRNSPRRYSSWHGTFVAGMIAATTGNDRGIAGVAPGVKIQPVRVLGRCGGYLGDILHGMEWASGGAGNEAGAAEVVNLSLNEYVGSTATRDSRCRAFNAVAEAGQSRGSLFVAAAGNEYGNANLSVPSACSAFVSVGATSVRGFSASYSNVGSSVDIVAPGGDRWVESTADRIRSISNVGSTDPRAQSYALAEGTSMAAPEVSAAAALLYSVGLETPSEVKRALRASVSPFRARSSSYSRKKVRIDDRTYTFDLNCAGHRWCGSGILDLSRVQAPVSKPVISGEARIGEPLAASIGSWVRRLTTPRYTWTVGGQARSGGSTYWPTRDDVGKAITVTVAPSDAAFAKLSSTSSATTPVPDGPDVVLDPLVTTTRYGTGLSATSRVDAPDGGTVELRTDGGTVLGAGVVTAGTVTFEVAGRALKPGRHVLRAAYLGDETTPAASSSRRAVTVTRLPAKVSAKVSTRIRPSSRATLRAEVFERPDLFVHPTGELRVYDGSKRIAVARLDGNDRGRKSIRLPKLKKGTHRIRVYFRDSAYVASTYSATRTVRSR